MKTSALYLFVSEALCVIGMGSPDELITLVSAIAGAITAAIALIKAVGSLILYCKTKDAKHLNDLLKYKGKEENDRDE